MPSEGKVIFLGWWFALCRTVLTKKSIVAERRYQYCTNALSTSACQPHERIDNVFPVKDAIQSEQFGRKSKEQLKR
jgi:hypothetical protein